MKLFFCSWCLFGHGDILSANMIMRCSGVEGVGFRYVYHYGAILGRSACRLERLRCSEITKIVYCSV